MRILRVISSVDPKSGGPIEGIKKINPELFALGIDVEIVCSDDPHSAWLSDRDLPLTHAMGPKMGKYGKNIHLFNWLASNIPRFDAVIIHGLWQYHGLAAYQNLRKTSIPYFVYSHGMLDPWFKRKYPLKHLKKWLYWPWAEYRILRDATKVIFTCEEERLLAKKTFWLYKCREVVTAYGTAPPPDAVENLRQRFLSAHSELRNKRNVLFLSRIHEKKGCDLLIRAFAKVATSHADLHLIMAGPDQTGWKAILLELAKSLNVEHKISWVGMLNGDDKWGAYFSAEVFCLPSHQENFGIVVAEALACGKPVLISNKVNIWREIEADGAGIVNDDTNEGTLKSLEKWLSLTEIEQITMTQSAKYCFNSKFRIDHVAKSLKNIVTNNTLSEQ